MTFQIVRMELGNQVSQRSKIRVVARQPVASSLALQHGNCLRVPILNLLNEVARVPFTHDLEVAVAATYIDHSEVTIDNRFLRNHSLRNQVVADVAGCDEHEENVIGPGLR